MGCMKLARRTRSGSARGRRGSGPAHGSTIRRKYKGKGYMCHLLRRTFREGKKVQNETVANLCDLSAPIIDMIRRALAGQLMVPAR